MDGINIALLLDGDIAIDFNDEEGDDWFGIVVTPEVAARIAHALLDCATTGKAMRDTAMPLHDTNKSLH